MRIANTDKLERKTKIILVVGFDSRARLDLLGGRIWPAGRHFDTCALTEMKILKTAQEFTSGVKICRNA